MDIRRLKAFMQLASCGHYGMAASRLHITQSTLSKQIQTLEHEVGGQLFERGRHGAVLTGLGVLLQREGADLLMRSEQLDRRLQQASLGQYGQLRIGFGISTLDRVPRCIADFQASYPQSQMMLDDLSSAEQHRLLEDGKLDLGFCRSPDASSGLLFAPLMAENLALVMPARTSWHWPADAEWLNTAGFIGITPERGGGLDRQIAHWSHATGWVPRVKQYAADVLTIHAIVSAGLGVALLPWNGVRALPRRVRVQRLSGEAANWWLGACWRPHEPDPLRDRFLAHIQSSPVFAPEVA